MILMCVLLGFGALYAIGVMCVDRLLQDDPEIHCARDARGE